MDSSAYLDLPLLKRNSYIIGSFLFVLLSLFGILVAFLVRDLTDAYSSRGEKAHALG